MMITRTWYCCGRGSVSIGNSLLTILVVRDRLGANSGIIGLVGGSHIGRCAVRWQAIWVTLLVGCKSSTGKSSIALVVVALPEAASASRASCVVVRGGGAECAFALVMAHECDLNES